MWHLTKIPKIAHFYWGGNALSYLRFMSVKSFRMLNPDWDIFVHVPRILSTATPGWDTFQQKNKEIEHDYFDQLNELDNLTICKHNFNRYRFSNQAHEVHKSDFLRWKLLNKHGGLWSDIDILYIRPMEQLAENCEELSHIDTALCPLLPPNKHTVGFLLSAPNNNFFKYIGMQARKEYNPEVYQCMGSDLINARFKTFESFKKRFRKHDFIFLDNTCVYSITSKTIEWFYQEMDRNIRKKIQHRNTIGFHWFAGHPVSHEFEKVLKHDNVTDYNNVLATSIRELTNETQC